MMSHPFSEWDKVYMMYDSDVLIALIAECNKNGMYFVIKIAS